jgi:hypothetical protein
LSEEVKKTDWKKVSTRMVRSGTILVAGVAAWAGIWMSGMGRPAAAVCSVAGGLLAMVVGMVAAGVRYHHEMQELAKHAGEEIEKVKGDLDKLTADVAMSKKQFGLSAVVMAKTVADNVAAKIVSQHTARLPNPEHVEAAMRDAHAVVVGEIVAYADVLRSK